MQQEKIIKKLLDDRNAGREQGYCFYRPLSDHVILVRAWMEMPAPDKPVSPLTAYLITNAGKYVGGVLDTDSSYAYMLAPFRKKGIMSTAMRATILPHILQQRPLVRVALNKAQLGERNYLSAKRLAAAVGFKVFGEQDDACKLLFDASGLKQRDFINGTNLPFNDTDLERLKKHLLYAASHVGIVRTELEFRQGISAISEELRDLAEAVAVNAERLPNAWFEGKGKGK